jgi:hypothetical protein
MPSKCNNRKFLVPAATDRGRCIVQKLFKDIKHAEDDAAPDVRQAMKDTPPTTASLRMREMMLMHASRYDPLTRRATDPAQQRLLYGTTGDTTRVGVQSPSAAIPPPPDGAHLALHGSHHEAAASHPAPDRPHLPQHGSQHESEGSHPALDGADVASSRGSHPGSSGGHARPDGAPVASQGGQLATAGTHPAPAGANLPQHKRSLEAAGSDPYPDADGGSEQGRGRGGGEVGTSREAQGEEGPGSDLKTGREAEGEAPAEGPALGDSTGNAEGKGPSSLPEQSGDGRRGIDTSKAR